MPYATAKDNVKLYYEETGSGTPILFCHEFAGDYRNWELNRPIPADKFRLDVPASYRQINQKNAESER